MAEPALLGVAATFALVTGANDGGALLATGLKLRGLRALSAIATLTLFVVAGPILFGSKVAQTFVSRLVTSHGAGERLPLLLGIGAAVVVVAALTRAGLPTSLTLAVIGGITGVGLGYGLPVSLSAAAIVLAVGMAAPFVGAILGYLISRLTEVAPARPSVPATIARLHRVAFALQCLAYGVNDGQKMLAVLVIAMGTGATTFRPGLASMALLALFFVIGIVVGLPRVAASLGDGLMAVRPVHAVSAEFAGALSVLGSAAIGVPVSMTQSLAGGLVGAGISQGRGRIRWRAVRRIWLAWLMTLPASVLLAALVGILAKEVGG